jgi:antagonist of KipI
MSFRIVKPGVLDTVQDDGRYGYSKWGINPGGTMDRYAAHVANLLVGNELNMAVVESHFPAAEIQFEETALISLAGADFTPVINNTPVSLWKPMVVKAGAVLAFKGRRSGARVYLAIHGGLSIQPWLGSSSTQMKIAAGGWNGRPLRKDDTISFAQGRYTPASLIDADVHMLPWSINVHPVYSSSDLISFTPGNEWDWLESSSQQRVLEQRFQIDSSSDRMGYYLLQEPLKFRHREELLSSAVSMGTIQSLSDGRLIILMADHQTTGGYARVGHVITAHLPKLSQRSAHETILLNKISIEDAEKILISLCRELHNLERSCREKLDHHYGKH